MNGNEKGLDGKIFKSKSRDCMLITVNPDLTSSLTAHVFAQVPAEKKVIDQYVVGSFCI